MDNPTILDALCYQALRRAIGELMAAQEAMRTDDNGEFPALATVITECIEKLQDEM